MRMTRNSRVLAAGVLLMMVCVGPAFSQRRGRGSARQTQPKSTRSEIITEAVKVRDPFWPVGYWPKTQAQIDAEKQAAQQKQVVQTKTAQTQKIQWPRLKIKGITGNIAILGDGIGIVEAGQTVSLTRKGVVYKWKINKISQKGISQTKLSARPAGQRSGKTGKR